jgi:hypothetical protein
VNEKLNFWIPQHIMSYIFWLNLGLYLGFRLCRYEHQRVWRKIEDDQRNANKEKLN